MEPNKEKKYWGKTFYESRLNTLLLLALIVSMIIAIKVMLRNETYYFPYLKNNDSLEKQSRKTTINYLENKISLYSGVSWQNQLPDYSYTDNLGLKGESVLSSEYNLIAENQTIKNKFREFYSEEMAKIGYHEAPEIIADGPGASQWGYKNGSSYLILSYEDKQITPKFNEPFDCPCTEQIKVFLGDKVSSQNE